MSNAKHDENGRSTMIATDSSDGVTVVLVTADPTNHGIKVMEGATGSDVGNNAGIANIDENSVSVFTALSSTGDGTVINIYADSATGALLVKST